MKKIALIAAMSGVAAFTHAVTWNLLIVPSAPLGTNWSASTIVGMTPVNVPFNVPTAGSNSITLLTPNANLLGNNLSGSVSWEYEATNLGAPAASMGYSIAGTVFGSGQIIWSESVFGIDNANNEIFINGAGGTITAASTTNNSFGLNGSISLTNSSFTKLRVKKSFILVTGSGPGMNSVSLSRVNQNIQVVPEPATMTALALGAAALLRRRKK